VIHDESVTVVPESRAQVNFLWGFLAIVSVLVVARAVTGDSATAWKVVAVVLFGVLFFGSILMWIWSFRHPGQVDVSADALRYQHRGQPRGTTLHRSSGDLYIRRVILNAKHPQAYLKVTGQDEDSIPLQMFSRRRLEEACLAHGWRFVDDPR
jgi:hypothetical protein